jgi:hypothetical protein
LIPTFTMIQTIAHDREEELRKEANQRYKVGGAPLRAQRPGLHERLAKSLRVLADRLDPEEGYGAELCAD